MNYARVTLRRPVSITACATEERGYQIAANAVQGQMATHDNGQEVTVYVHTAYTFEKDGTARVHQIGDFAKTLATLVAEEGDRPGDDDKYNRGRVRFWSFDNREARAITIPLSNVDGVEADPPKEERST